MTAVTHPDRCFPRLHPRPAEGWLNDPNGIHLADGTWHLFFQYNPTSARHHLISWGHFSSPDLVTWTERPVAISPQPGGPDSYGCFTGVGLVDDGVPTLVYSGVTADDGNSSVVIVRQGGDSDAWVQDGHVAAGMPREVALTAMRDPFLFSLGGRRWSVQAGGLPDGTAALMLHDATDLERWEERGLLLRGDHPVAAQLPPSNIWECPQLVRVGDDWVAILSLWEQGRLTGVGYLVGDLTLDPETALPHFEPRTSGLLDVGECYYAPQAVQVDEQGRVLVWGWAREDAAAGVPGRSQEEIDAVGWSGSLTFPHELVVVDSAARLLPAPELSALRGEPCEAGALPDQAEVSLAGAGRARLVLADGAERLVVWETTVSDGAGARIFVDASVIEAFPEEGPSATLRAYPTGAQRYAVEADAGVEVQAWGLRLPA